ncbi:MAG: hypothetical protein HGB00_07220 [Chlorobiaceae bacterium]|nr:hypothetical protein [Chlorobiaceae bacterium]
MATSVSLMVYAYWALAVAIGLFFFRKDIFTFDTKFDTRRTLLLVFSVVILAINAYVYTNSTSDGGRPVDPLSVLIFSIGNGVAETFYFYAFFRLGENLAGRFTANQWAKFITGFVFFMIYSGIIHRFFWLDILPTHVVQTSPLKPFFMPVQLMIASSWALAFFWYRDLRTVIILHSIVDFTMIMNVKFSLFN